MDLRTYFTAHDGKVSRTGARLLAVAKACGIKPYYLYMVALGHKPVNAELANQLHEATGGKCHRRELCPSFQWDEPKRRKAA